MNSGNPSNVCRRLAVLRCGWLLMTVVLLATGCQTTYYAVIDIEAEVTALIGDMNRSIKEADAFAQKI